MSMTQIDLPYGDGILSFEIDKGVLGEVVAPRLVKTAPDADAEIRYALERPIGSPPLSDLVHHGQKIAIVIDDITRQTPTQLILPPILHCLKVAGIEQEAVKIVVALGTHRPMTESEIHEKVGSAIANEYHIVNVPCWDDAEMVYMGRSSNGIPAWINRNVIDADFRIGIGMITPHMDAGFSGGGKIILPGVCSCRTVEAFHLRQARVLENQLGAGEAMLRRDLETFVEERIGIDFILNVILDRKGLLYRSVSGHFVQAHRVGVDIAKTVYGSPVSKRYPVVITNAYPTQIDLWQSTKALASGEMMTDDGGTLILVTHCQEGNNTHPLFADYLGRDPEHLIHALESGRAEDIVACALAVPLSRMRRHIKFGLVSSGLSKADAERMGFIYYHSVENAIKEALKTQGSHSAVSVLTHGGVTLPMIQ